MTVADRLGRACAIAVIVLYAVAILPAGAEMPLRVATLTGTAKVKDGDSLVLGRIEIRLQGVAAPEKKADMIGPKATRALRALVSEQTVTCDLDGTKTHGRFVAVCYVDGADLGEALIRQGVARDCPHFSGGRYAPAEQAARQSGRDLSQAYDLPGYC